jgi:hypothetical protein
MTFTFTIAAFSLAVVLPGDDGQASPADSRPAPWRYVVPAPGDAFEHAPFRALVLSREKPEELIEKVAYRGDPARRRYARIRFGSPSSTRVTVVVDVVASGAVDLYADADRNLKIDDRDHVAAASSANGSGGGRLWRLPLAVAMIDNGAVREVPRAVVFRLGGSGHTLAYAVAGYLEGQVVVGHSLPARRVDGDGNGLLADAQDRIWIDLNRDGHFDPSSEQFLFASVLNLEGARFVVLSDEVGSRLAFEPLVGTGSLRLAFKGHESSNPTKIVEMQATAISRDGSVFALSGNQTAIVPAGEYRLGTVIVAFDDSKTGRRWSFVFSDGGARGQPRWYKVEKDAVVTIDPIGTPALAMTLSDQNNSVRPGADVGLQPALYTGDGLLIVVAYCGNPIAPAVQEILGARIAVLTSDGKALATAHSGFS